MAKGPHDAALQALRAFGLAYPGAHTKSPWPGHLDLAVNDKTFAYLSLAGEPLAISCKLPLSHEAALMLPFTKPTAYGLGRSGWVSATFAPIDDPPVDLLRAWIDESYRAQAPKKLVKLLGQSDAAPEKTTARKPKAPAKKASTKNASTKNASTKNASTKNASTKKASTKKASTKKASTKKARGKRVAKKARSTSGR